MDTILNSSKLGMVSPELGVPGTWCPELSVPGTQGEPGLGMRTRRTGGATYVPDLARLRENETGTQSRTKRGRN